MKNLEWNKIFKFVELTGGAVSKSEDGRTETDILINAAILAGLGFFSTFAGLLATNLTADPTTTFIAAGTSSGLQFFTSLALQRGLKK